MPYNTNHTFLCDSFFLANIVFTWWSNCWGVMNGSINAFSFKKECILNCYKCQAFMATVRTKCNSIQNIFSCISSERHILHTIYINIYFKKDFWMHFFSQPQAPKVFAEGSFVNPLRKTQIQQRKDEVCALLVLLNKF